MISPSGVKCLNMSKKTRPPAAKVHVLALRVDMRSSGLHVHGRVPVKGPSGGGGGDVPLCSADKHMKCCAKGD